MPNKRGRKQKSNDETVKSEPQQATAKIDHAFASSGVSAKGKLRFNTKTRTALIVLIAGVFIGGSLVAWRISRDTQQDDVNVQSLLNQLAENKTRVDYGSVLPDIDAAIEQAERDDNTDQLLVLHAYRASLAASNNEPRKAIGSYVARNRLDPNTTNADAYMLAQAYEGAGQKEKAIQKYELALAYYEQNQPSDEALEDTVGNDYYITAIQQKLGTLKAGDR